MYFLEWGIWKGRLLPQSSTERETARHFHRRGQFRDFAGLAEAGAGVDKVSQVEPDDAFALYAFNDRHIDVRAASQEEKRGLITFVTLSFLALDVWFIWTGIVNDAIELIDVHLAGSGDDLSGRYFLLISTVLMLTFFNWFAWKFLKDVVRLEIFTQRHLVVRFNRVTRQVHINRPNYAGGIVTLPWDATAAGIDPNQPDERMIGMPLLLAWPAETSGAGFDEFAMLGEPMDGNRKVVGLWEFIRRYMEDGPSSVRSPRRLRPLWPSPALSLREVISFLSPMSKRGGGAFSLLWGSALLPLMTLHFVCHWVSMMLCYRARWPKVIREAGLPGRPIPKLTVAEDYGPEVGARLREATQETRGKIAQT